MGDFFPASAMANSPTVELVQAFSKDLVFIVLDICFILSHQTDTIPAVTPAGKSVTC